MAQIYYMEEYQGGNVADINLLTRPEFLRVFNDLYDSEGEEGVEGFIHG